MTDSICNPDLPLPCLFSTDNNSNFSLAFGWVLNRDFQKCIFCTRAPPQLAIIVNCGGGGGADTRYEI